MVAEWFRHLVVSQDDMGSNPICHTNNGSLAESLGGGLQNLLDWLESNRNLKFYKKENDAIRF